MRDVLKPFNSGKAEEVKKLQDTAKALYDEVEAQRARVNLSLQRLTTTKVRAVNSLSKLCRLSENLGARQRTLLPDAFEKIELVSSLNRIDVTLSAADVVLSTGKGTVAGVSTALGTWALVSTTATASTGTAIGTLSGAAATNATLAWLGGGSVAAGGGGMTLGAAVLGGIVVVPALVLGGIFSHLKANKQIAEIQARMLEVLQAMDGYQKVRMVLDALGRRAEELDGTILHAADVFDAEFRTTYAGVYPLGVLSKAWRWIKRLLGKRYFNDADLRLIAPLLQMGSKLAVMIDTKILDKEGQPQ